MDFAIDFSISVRQEINVQMHIIHTNQIATFHERNQESLCGVYIYAL